MSEQCESGCSAPGTERVGKAWLCDECVRSMVDAPVAKEREPQKGSNATS